VAAKGGLLKRKVLSGLFWGRRADDQRPAIQNLKRKVLSGLVWGLVFWAALPLQAEEPGLRPRLRVDEPVFKDARFRPGTTFSHDFILRNEGRAPLLIVEVRTGCSCAAAAHDRTIAPGGQGRVRLSVDVPREWAGRDILRTVWLTTNDPEAAQVSLAVRGRVAQAAGP